LDSASEQTQPEEKKEEDFFTTSLSADNSSNSDEADNFKVQTPEVSFSALMVEMKYFFVIFFRKALGHNKFPIHSCFQKCTLITYLLFLLPTNLLLLHVCIFGVAS
jgi:hypothetical protein